DRGRHEPRQAARGRRGRHADRAVRRAQGRSDGPRAWRRQAVPLPRPGLGRLHLPRPRRRLRVQAELRRVPGLVGVAGHDIGFLPGYRSRVGAVLGWWFAFTRDLRRERTFTIDDMAAARPYKDPLIL